MTSPGLIQRTDTEWATDRVGPAGALLERGSLRGASLLISTLLLAACGDRVARDRTVVRDSAGVRIVESVAPRSRGAEGPRLSEPVISIGVVEGAPAYQFDAPRFVLLREDGGTVVADRSREIRYFDSRGMHVRTVGGPGEGPGEFRVIGRLFVLGSDSLLAFDAPLARSTLFAPDGTLVRSTPMADQNIPLGLLADGRGVWFRSGPPSGSLHGLLESGIDLVLGHSVVAADTLRHDRLAAGFAFSLPNGRMILGVPYARTLAVAASADRIVAGGAVDNQVDVYLEGCLAGSYRWSEPRRAVTEAMRSVHRDWVSRNNRQMADGQVLRERFAELPFPDSLPSFDQIRLDRRNARIWIRRYHVQGDAESWLVLDEGGTWLGSVVLPERFQLIDVAGDRLAGVWRDDLDVAYVRVYEVHGLR